METVAEPSLAESVEKLHKFADRLEKVVQPAGNTNTASMVFNMGGAGFLIGAALGIGGLALAYGFHKDAEAERIQATANMQVLAAERRADMAELSMLRAQVSSTSDDIKGLRAWDARFTSELATIKAASNVK